MQSTHENDTRAHTRKQKLRLIEIRNHRTQRRFNIANTDAGSQETSRTNPWDDMKSTNERNTNEWTNKRNDRNEHRKNHTQEKHKKKERKQCLIKNRGLAMSSQKMQQTSDRIGIIISQNDQNMNQVCLKKWSIFRPPLLSLFWGLTFTRFSQTNHGWNTSVCSRLAIYCVSSSFSKSFH